MSKKFLIASIIGALVVCALGAPANATPKLTCAKTEPMPATKFATKGKLLAPKNPVAAVYCSYDNTQAGQPLVKSRQVAEPAAFAAAINASKALPAANNYACTKDLGPTSVVYFLDAKGNKTMVMKDEFGCGFIYSSMSAGRWALTMANQGMWKMYAGQAKGIIINSNG